MFFVYPSAVDLSRHGVLSVSCVFFSQCSPSLLCTTCSLCWRFNDVTLRPKKPYLSLVRYRKLTACFWLLCFLPSVGIVLMAWREFLSDDLIPKLCLCILVNTQVDDYSLAFLLYCSSLYSLSIVGTVISYIITFTVNVNSTAEDRCVTKLCMLVSVVYTVCWTPFLLVQLLEIFGSYTKVYFNLHACASAIGVFTQPSIQEFIQQWMHTTGPSFALYCSAKPKLAKKKASSVCPNFVNAEEHTFNICFGDSCTSTCFV